MVQCTALLWTVALSLVGEYHLNHNMVLIPITAMLIRQLNVVVMNALIGIYVIFILKGLVLSTLVLKI